jgi:hypothetical protein
MPCARCNMPRVRCNMLRVCCNTGRAVATHRRCLGASILRRLSAGTAAGAPLPRVLRLAAAHAMNAKGAPLVRTYVNG